MVEKYKGALLHLKHSLDCFDQGLFYFDVQENDYNMIPATSQENVQNIFEPRHSKINKSAMGTQAKTQYPSVVRVFTVH